MLQFCKVLHFRFEVALISQKEGALRRSATPFCYGVKRDGWLVVGVQHVNSPDAPFFKPDTEGVKTHSAIAAALGDAPTVVKSEADSFFKTNLEQIVR